MRSPIMHSDRRPNADRSPEALEARLRALPQSPVPADLEARLLATIPAERPIPPRRWAVRVGVVGALAAACLLAVLAWLGRDGKGPAPRPPTTESARKDTPRPPDASASIAAWLESRRVLDEATIPTF